MAVNIDDLDRRIMDALREDGRASNSAVAERLGVTEGTVRQRTRRLFESGVFKVAGLANPEIMPDHQVCVIGLKVKESRQLEACAEQVRGLSEVRSVSIVTGRYDLLVEVLVPHNQGLITFLSRSLSLVQGVQSTETFLLLKTLDKWI